MACTAGRPPSGRSPSPSGIAHRPRSPRLQDRTTSPSTWPRYDQGMPDTYGYTNATHQRRVARLRRESKRVGTDAAGARSESGSTIDRCATHQTRECGGSHSEDWRRAPALVTCSCLGPGFERWRITRGPAPSPAAPPLPPGVRPSTLSVFQRSTSTACARFLLPDSRDDHGGSALHSGVWNDPISGSTLQLSPGGHTDAAATRMAPAPATMSAARARVMRFKVLVMSDHLSQVGSRRQRG